MKIKFLATFMIASLCLPAFAEDCPVEFPGESYSDKVVSLIENTTSCWAATKLADICAIGATADYYTTVAARAKCALDYKGKLTPEDQKILTALHKKCEAKYKGQQGSMYLSGESFCHLNVDRLFSELYSPVD